MLLMKLETKEKFAFLELAHHVSLVDSDYSLREKSLINDFCIAMGIEDSRFDDSTFDFDDTLKSFRSNQSKKIVILTLMMLAHIDDNFDQNEYQIICKIAKVFNFTQKDINLFSQWGKSVSGLYAQAIFFMED
ncbi:hypothetical protein A9Q76_09100 [Arcobacter sp. 31_11_sub10_T18]|nr:hypothetical protein A9Q76_09100 [Arcobacter sp. 31_11_sub10_T18]